MPERWCACKLLTLIPRLPRPAPQVMLFSQGIETAEELAGKIVLLFHLCEEQLSPQPHYDFGLRALKTVLVSHHGIQPTVAHTRGSAYNPPSSLPKLLLPPPPRAVPMVHLDSRLSLLSSASIA